MASKIITTYKNKELVITARDWVYDGKHKNEIKNKMLVYQINDVFIPMIVKKHWKPGNEIIHV